MESDQRSRVYMARRIIRAKDPVAFARKHKVQDDAAIQQLVAMLPDLLAQHCIAKAEALAVETVFGNQAA